MEDKPIISFEEFLELIETKKITDCPPLRHGQLIINTLYLVWPEEYKRISSVHYYDQTDIDCFYNDKLIENTLNFLESIWK